MIALDRTDLGQTRRVKPAELVLDVRRILVAAGYQVVDDGQGPGLNVAEVSAGARVRWVNSQAFAALAEERPSREDLLRMRLIVQAAVSALLVQVGHTVAEGPDGGDVVVLLGPWGGRG